MAAKAPTARPKRKPAQKKTAARRKPAARKTAPAATTKNSASAETESPETVVQVTETTAPPPPDAVETASVETSPPDETRIEMPAPDDVTDSAAPDAETEAETKAADEAKAAAAKKAEDDALAAWADSCRDDPLKFVMEAFDWGKGLLKDHDGPDEWQADVLRAAATDPKGAVRIAVASGHGVGKSALVAWLILWAMSTRPHLAGVVTANTQVQLETKTWRELAVWHKRARNRRWFRLTANRLCRVGHADTWFVAAVPWTRERSEAFAGLHGGDVLVIYDEASAIADEIWEVSEGAMTTPRAHWFAFGNPTRTSGRFRECFGRFRHRWQVFQIDASHCRLASKEQIRSWIADYGEDSDFVRVRVKGEFPNASTTQFIAGDLVAAAGARTTQSTIDAPLVFGVDVARYGDDQTVILLRRGNMIEQVLRYRGIDTMQTGGRVADMIAVHHPDAVFIDGIGVGAGVVDRVRQLGHAVIEVNAGGAANDTKRYANKRAEMWGRLRDWLQRGGCLPPEDRALAEDVAGPEYGFDATNRIMLERKEDMKRRGLASPDAGDALAMTFAESVALPPLYPDLWAQTIRNWDPLEY